jgi:osmotically-inducible protein OsmY
MSNPGHYEEEEREDARSTDRVRQIADVHIRNDVQDTLDSHVDLDMSGVEVRVFNGEVTLSGSVDNDEAKLAAQVSAEQCSGVTEVKNNIRVAGDSVGHQRWRVGDGDSGLVDFDDMERGE